MIVLLITNWSIYLCIILWVQITGDTVYNVPKFDELSVDENDRPAMPPKIIRTEILHNPFTDIEPRKKKVVEAPKVKEKKQKK